jgi:hypothetical protein
MRQNACRQFNRNRSRLGSAAAVRIASWRVVPANAAEPGSIVAAPDNLSYAIEFMSYFKTLGRGVIEPTTTLHRRRNPARQNQQNPVVFR